MRSIKFRAWNKGKMHNDFTFGEDSVNYGFKTAVITIMQYTGLKDIDNIEVFEDDVVYIEGHYESDTWVVSCYIQVVIEDGGFNLDYADIKNFDIRVVGNIYENKELLNG